MEGHEQQDASVTQYVMQYQQALAHLTAQQSQISTSREAAMAASTRAGEHVRHQLTPEQVDRLTKFWQHEMERIRDQLDFKSHEVGAPCSPPLPPRASPRTTSSPYVRRQSNAVRCDTLTAPLPVGRRAPLSVVSADAHQEDYEAG